MKAMNMECPMCGGNTEYAKCSHPVQHLRRCETCAQTFDPSKIDTVTQYMFHKLRIRLQVAETELTNLKAKLKAQG